VGKLFGQGAANVLQGRPQQEIDAIRKRVIDGQGSFDDALRSADVGNRPNNGQDQLLPPPYNPIQSATNQIGQAAANALLWEPGEQLGVALKSIADGTGTAGDHLTAGMGIAGLIPGVTVVKNGVKTAAAGIKAMVTGINAGQKIRSSANLLNTGAKSAVEASGSANPNVASAPFEEIIGEAIGIRPNRLDLSNPSQKLEFSRWTPTDKAGRTPWADEDGHDVVFRALGMKGKSTAEARAGHFWNSKGILEMQPTFIPGPVIELESGTLNWSERSKFLAQFAVKLKNYLGLQEGGAVNFIIPDAKGLSYHVGLGT
jgi:hypothetical protein